MNRKGPTLGAENSHRRAGRKGRGLGSLGAGKADGRGSKDTHPPRPTTEIKIVSTAVLPGHECHPTKKHDTPRDLTGSSAGAASRKITQPTELR